jgi:hypothetical protein
MTKLVIPCPHCTSPSQIDTDRLPDRPSFFPCPHCNGRVVVDRRDLVGQAGETPPPQAVAHAPVQPTAAAIPPPAVEPKAPDRRFPKVPADAILPSGIIVGDEDAAVEQIREVLAALGSEVERVGSLEDARRTIVEEQPDLCICVLGKVDAASHAAMEPLRGLHPGVRRRVYILLVGDNLKTFDGNAAFMLEANLVLAKQDLARIGEALYGGVEYHARLYKTYLEACENRGAI